MAALAKEIEGGKSARDAVAEMYKTNRNVIFTGNGYSAEWPSEAAKRGLPNLNTTPKAVASWASDKNMKLFESMGVFSAEETEARSEVMFEAYVTTLSVEAQTLVQMLEKGIIPACVKDLAKYKDFPKMAGGRPELYDNIVSETDRLKILISSKPEGLEAE